VSDEPPGDDLPYRDWQLERVSDKQFTFVVPPVKWDFFTARLRPLADDCATAVTETLFTGVTCPFHYQRAKGWMGKIFQAMRAATPDDRRRTADEALKEAFAKAGVGPAFVIYHLVGFPVYAAESATMLDCLRRGWLTTNYSFVLCAEHTPAVALYWDGYGPFFGKRRHRRLT
jgi:hypothetical protein